MRLQTIALGTALTLFSATVSAEFSGYITLTSDYDYRGFSQTATDPAVQGGLDYAHDSGFYASAWGSTLDWGKGSDADIEIDYIAGFSRNFGESGIAWDVGYIAYTYPGAGEFNFGEIYGGLSTDLFSIKLSYSDDFSHVGQSAWYVDGGFQYAWDNGWGVLAYIAYSFGNAFDPDDGMAFGFPDYWNYGAAVGYTLGHLYFEAKVVGTDLSGSYKTEDGVFANDFRGLLSITLAFP